MTFLLPRRDPGRSAPLAFVVHLAGLPSGDGVQNCALCGLTILDHTAWFAGRVAVPEAGASEGPHWWPPGEQVAVMEGVSYLVAPDGRPLTPHERLCSGAN